MQKKNLRKAVHDKLKILVDKGFYDDEDEIVREDLRNHLNKYKSELEKNYV